MRSIKSHGAISPGFVDHIAGECVGARRENGRRQQLIRGHPDKVLILRDNFRFSQRSFIW
jgi:hypothetical protein